MPRLPSKWKSVVFTPSGVRIRFTLVPGVGAYDVYRRQGSKRVWTKIAESTDDLFIDKSTEANRVYWYRVAEKGKTTKEANLPALRISMATRTATIPGATYALETPGTIGAPVIAAPAVQPLTLTVTAAIAGNATVLASDPQGLPLTYTITTPPAVGTLSISGAVLTYSRAAAGSETAVVTVSNGTASTPLTVSLVTLASAANVPPVAGPVSASVVAGQSVVIPLPVSDADGQVAAIESVTAPASGSVIYDASARTATYTSVGAGTVAWTYRASDGTDWSTAAQISVTVSSGNRPPVANNASTSTTQGRAIDLAPPAQDPDTGDVLTPSIVTAPAHGTATIIAGNLIRYRPASGYFGSDSFQFRVTDLSGDVSNTGTITVSVAPVAPLPEETVVVTLSASNTAAQNGTLFRNALRTVPAGKTLYVEPYQRDAFLVDRWGDLPSNIVYKGAGVLDNVSVTVKATDTAQIEPPTTLNVSGIQFISPRDVWISPMGVTGNPGTSGAPTTWAQAKNLVNGGWANIRFAAGVYTGQYQVWWSRKRTRKYAPLGILMEAGAWVEGGETLASWTRVGTSAVYYHTWAHDFFTTPNDGNNRVLKDHQDPIGRAEQFVVDGQPLEWGHDFADNLTIPANLQSGQFTVDYAADRVYVRLPLDADPATKTIVGSVRQWAFRSEYTDGGNTFRGNYENVLLRANVRNQASWPKANNAAVRTERGWNTRVDLRCCSGYGLAFAKDDNESDGSNVDWIGVTSMGGQGAPKRLGVLNVTGTRWNYKRYSGKGPRGVQLIDGGQYEFGAKFARSVGAVIKGWVVSHVVGPAVWMDIDNYGFRIEDCTFTDLLPSGITGPDSYRDTCGVFIEIGAALTGGVRGIIRRIRVERSAGWAIKCAESSGYDISDITAIGCNVAIYLRNITIRAQANPTHVLRDIAITNVKARGMTRSMLDTSHDNWDTATAFSDKAITVTGATLQSLTNAYRVKGKLYTPAQARARFGAGIGTGDVVGVVT